MKSFLSIQDCTSGELKELLTLSRDLKALYKSGKRDTCLPGKVLAMLFEKTSLRTRVSFQVAMADLGGTAIYLKPEDIGIIGKREPAKDMARVFARYVDCIVARTFSHETILELDKWSHEPIINALSDWSHPCQAMADILTIREHCGDLTGLKLAYIGDGNNVARSLAFAGAKFNMQFVCASPTGYELEAETLAAANQILPDCASQTHDPVEAVTGAQVVYTDTWTSMGQEAEKTQRIADFKGFSVDETLMQKASKNAKIMHCLPAYRGYEISDGVMESKNSIVFDQAENRLHFQRALLKYLIVK
ncbi:MAG: ornithine carbamoyltransferase [Planctomycetales bacterium 4572_13]|nr:MAG: ornithine carbamoyltransferase [Planctomycetales bacterium 4572_13]